MTDHVSVSRYKPISISLEEPAIVDGAQVSTLTMRPPRALDVINASDFAPTKNQVDAQLFANLCNVPLQTVMGLAYYDYKQLEVAYDRFLYPTQLHCEMESLPLSAALEVLTRSALQNSTQNS